MDEKVYTMSEAAKIIGVSRQSVYKKIDRPDLQPYIQDTDKGKILSAEGLEILKGLFSEYLDSKPEGDNLQQDNSNPTDSLHTVDSMTVEYIQSLKTEIEHLKGIIAGQAQQTTDLTRLLENSQVLLKKEQERNQLLLEAAQAPLEAPKDGFFARFFKK